MSHHSDETESPESKSFVEFITDNQQGIKGNMSNLSGHLRNVWDTVPEMLSGLMGNLGGLFMQIWMKLRSFLLFQMTTDMNHLNTARSLWDRCEMMHLVEEEDGSRFELMTNRILKNTHDDATRIRMVKRFRAFVRKGAKQPFLSFYIEQQDDKDFVWTKEQYEFETHMKKKPPIKTVTVTKVTNGTDHMLE